MKVKISDKQYAMIEKIARTKVGLNPQWWRTYDPDFNIANNPNRMSEKMLEKYNEQVLSNINGLVREAMVAKYFDSVGVAYDWWIPFASGTLVDRVSEFHVSKHKIDVKPILELRYIEDGEPLPDGKIDMENTIHCRALDATRSFFINDVDDVYIGVYLNDSMSGDIRGYQWRKSNKWKRYLREYDVGVERKFAEAMCCPVGDLEPMSSFKDIDDIIFNKGPTSHRFINVNRNPAIPKIYKWLGNSEDYDVTFIENWCKEWRLTWEDGIFSRSQNYKTWKVDHKTKTKRDVSKETVGIVEVVERVESLIPDKGTVGTIKVIDRRKLNSEYEDVKRKLNSEYEDVKRKLKEEDLKRRLDREYEDVKRSLKKDDVDNGIEVDDNIMIANGINVDNENENVDTDNINNVDVVGIANGIIAKSQRWKQLTRNIVFLSDKKNEKIKRKDELEKELGDIVNDIGILSDDIDNHKKEIRNIEESFRLIGNIENKNENGK